MGKNSEYKMSAINILEDVSKQYKLHFYEYSQIISRQDEIHRVQTASTKFLYDPI
jgi:hypothetical protein